jgi:hypothetical protein
MDRKLTLLALACAAALSCTAMAQTSGSSGSPSSTGTPASTPTQTSPSTLPTSPTTPTSPTSNPSGLTPPPGTANSTTSTTGTAANNQMFASLDRTKKGYLTQSDVTSNQFLSTNFQRCDTNNDTRLSESEVATCMQGAPQSR